MTSGDRSRDADGVEFTVPADTGPGDSCLRSGVSSVV